MRSSGIVGPDEQGEYRDPVHEVGLAMRRLSILDLAGGHQPMSNAKGTLWIVYNGEIFNSPELRAELEKKGRQFRTNNSDTEVLLHLYEERGEEMFSRSTGCSHSSSTIKRRNCCLRRAIALVSSHSTSSTPVAIRFRVRIEEFSCLAGFQSRDRFGQSLSLHESAAHSGRALDLSPCPTITSGPLSQV